MDPLNDAAARGVQKGMDKTAQSGARKAVRQLPEFLLSTAPKSSMDLMQNAMSGRLNPRTVAQGGSDIAETLSDEIAKRAPDVYQNRGAEGIMELAMRRQAISQLGQDLGQVAQSPRAGTGDLLSAAQRNPAGIGMAMDLAERSNRTSGPPSWLLPSAGAGAGMTAGAVVSE